MSEVEMAYLATEINKTKRQLEVLQRRLEEATRRPLVEVQFHGHPKRYIYELAPGHEAAYGDYVAVHSPLSDQTELVRVVGTPRTSTFRSHKIARQVDWHLRVP